MDVDEYIWETLYIMKALFDHEKGQDLLESYAHLEIDPDYIGDIVWQSMGYIFSDTRQYYNEDSAQESWVFFDPIINEFYSLCQRYEQEKTVEPKDNLFRRDLRRSLECCFSFRDYNYDYYVYDSPNDTYRIVLVLGCEFLGHYEAVSGLLDLNEAYHLQVIRLKEELGIIPKHIPEETADETADEAAEWKEAA